MRQVLSDVYGLCKDRSVRDSDYEAICQGGEAWVHHVKAQTERNPNWKADLSGADLSGANLTRATLTEATLAFADLTRATLTEATLAFADLTDAILNGADLTDANLTDATLTYATLTGANLNRATLNRATLTDANLTRATLTDANLTDADLAVAHLSRADLSRADLSRADLTGANLTGANLTGANLTGANLTRSILAGTYLLDMDVSVLCAAEDVRHWGPSIIDVRTLIRSYTHPRIVPFMVACGIPETFALYMVECAHAENQGDLLKMMYSTFISYGGPDEEFAQRLYEALRPTVSVFFFPEDAPWGSRIGQTVYREVQRHERVLLICSKDSLTRPGQRQEIVETLEREDTDGGATYLLPVRLDDYLFDPDGWIRDEPELTKRLRRRVVGDFRRARTNQHEFDSAVHRLLQELMKDRPGREE